MLLVSHRKWCHHGSDFWAVLWYLGENSGQSQLPEYLLEAADIFSWSSVVLKQVIPVELKQFKDTGMSVYATESPPLLFLKR